MARRKWLQKKKDPMRKNVFFRKKKAAERVRYVEHSEKKKAAERVRYVAHSKKKKAAERVRYVAHSEKKKAAERMRYVAHFEKKKAAERVRYVAHSAQKSWQTTSITVPICFKGGLQCGNGISTLAHAL